MRKMIYVSSSLLEDVLSALIHKFVDMRVKKFFILLHYFQIFPPQQLHKFLSKKSVDTGKCPCFELSAMFLLEYKNPHEIVRITNKIYFF